MKKNLLGLIIFCCMGLLFSCSNDDDTSDVNAKQLLVSATLPADIAVEQPEIAGHKMRAILELWTKGEGAQLAYHEEVAVDLTTETNKLSFDLTINAGTYDCLMWVDYVDASSTMNNWAEDGTSRYVDKYYDTYDLRNITVKNMNSLINNEACDAFYYSGEVHKKDNKAFLLELDMIRPFTKVSVLEKNLREFKLLRGLSSSFEAATTFNVSTGTIVGNMASVKHSVSEFNPESAPDGTLFSTYIFANEESRNMGEIVLSFTTKQGIQNVTVPADLVPVIRNQHIKVSGNMMAESPMDDTEVDIIYDINVDDWDSDELDITARPIKAKLGDFFYADGTYSSSYVKDENNPCIGIVFAVTHDNGAAATDSPENYPGTNLKAINGWVVAAYDFRDGINDANLMPRKSGVSIPEALKGNMDDIQGFMKTELLKTQTLSDYPIADIIVKYQNEGMTKAPDNTSGWYWGAAKQYDILGKVYAEVKDGQLVKSLAVRNSLQVLADAGVGELFPANGNERRYWYSTATDKKNKGIWAGFVCLGVGNKDYGGFEDDWWAVTNSGNARAILTF